MWKLPISFFSVIFHSFKKRIWIVCICFLIFISIRLMYYLPILNAKFFVEKTCRVHAFSRFSIHFDVTSHIEAEPKGVPLQDPSKSNNTRKNINMTGSSVVTWKFLIYTENPFIWCKNYPWRKNILEKSISHGLICTFPNLQSHKSYFS